MQISALCTYGKLDLIVCCCCGGVTWSHGIATSAQCIEPSFKQRCVSWGTDFRRVSSQLHCPVHMEELSCTSMRQTYCCSGCGPRRFLQLQCGDEALVKL